MERAVPKYSFTLYVRASDKVWAPADAAASVNSAANANLLISSNNDELWIKVCLTIFYRRPLPPALRLAPELELELEDPPPKLPPELLLAPLLKPPPL